MTGRLSNAFFGDKKLTEAVYVELFSNSQSNNRRLTKETIKSIFAPYTQKLNNIKSETDSSLTLLDVFIEFLNQIEQKFSKWEFKKFSSVIEIAAHVFEHSFQHWLSKEQSFKYFSEVIVRHSLFRPPHSVCIFNYEEMKQITQFWIDHFHRFYQQYEQCFKSELSQTLSTVAFPLRTQKQQKLNTGKTINKETVLNFL